MPTRSPPKHPPSRNWARDTEAQSLALHPAVLEQAIENSRTLADDATRMELAREIVLARGPELTLAYRSVVMVQPGYRKTRGEDGREQLTREPCVVFVVRRKWAPSRTAQGDRQCLPQWLITFADHAGQRLPFAVPTDVQEMAGFRGARAHGPGSVWVEPPGVSWEHGAAACAVRLDSDQGSQLCLLSAQHVLTPATEVSGLKVQGGLPARPLDASRQQLHAPVVATSLSVGGLLRGDQNPYRPSLDVQLARVDDPGAAQAIVGARQLDPGEPWVGTPRRLSELAAIRWFHLLVPDNNGPAVRGPLKAQLDSRLALPFGLDYRLRRGGQFEWVKVYHDELLKFQVMQKPYPEAGDSGCAVVVMHSDGSVTLAGLYIGGGGDAAYAIPAWHLFNLNRWWSYPPGARIEPVSI
jgi:hypothetical protein